MQMATRRTVITPKFLQNVSIFLTEALSKPHLSSDNGLFAFRTRLYRLSDMARLHNVLDQLDLPQLMLGYRVLRRGKTRHGDSCDARRCNESRASTTRSYEPPAGR